MSKVLDEQKSSGVYSSISISKIDAKLKDSQGAVIPESGDKTRSVGYKWTIIFAVFAILTTLVVIAIAISLPFTMKSSPTANPPATTDLASAKTEPEKVDKTETE